MNGLDFLAEKIGRKQLIAIVGMIVLAQVGVPAYQITLVAIAGIGSQLLIDALPVDWFRVRKKLQIGGQADGDTQRLS